MKCEICDREYRLTMKCPKCGADCCYEDLECHGIDGPDATRVNCVAFSDWDEIETPAPAIEGLEEPQ